MSLVPVKIFISYAHKDAPFFEVFKDGIRNHLSSSNVCDFSSWTDADIPLGSNWDEEIQKKLGAANVAILCVSANFLNSRYIKADEFENLQQLYPGTLIIPVYFNHCNMNAWKDLAIRQFFKPAGDRYSEAGQADFAFCDLVGFSKNEGLYIPNPYIDLYLQDLVKKMETAITGKTESYDDKEASPVFINTQINSNKKEKKFTDKIVELVILAAIVLSLGFIVYTLAFNGNDTFDSKKFNGTIGAAMFFGSSGLFVVNRKFQHN